MIDRESAMDALCGLVGLSISDQCRILCVSRVGYYRWLKALDADKHETNKPAAQKHDDMDLVNTVMDAWTEHPSYGYRKMGYFLRQQGYEAATEKRVRLIYKRLGIHGASQAFKTTRTPKGKYYKYQYLLKDKAVSFVNQVWATDITYIKLPGKMVYLTAVIDWYSRKILSWRLGESMDTDFCLEALHEAIYEYGIPAIFNTDCGSQYLSDAFISTLKSYGIEISMDAVGRCLDNIYVERTWKTVKYEFIFLHDWSTTEGLRKGLEWFVESFNNERPHEGLGYQTPEEVYRKGCFPAKETNIKDIGVA